MAGRKWSDPEFARADWEYGVRVPITANRVVASGAEEYVMSDVRLPDRAMLWQFGFWQYGAVSSWGGGVRIGLADFLPASAAEFDKVEQILRPSWNHSEGGVWWQCLAYGSGVFDVRVPFEPQGRRLVWELHNSHYAGVWLGGMIVVGACEVAKE